ncbi:hypothetical protein ACA910_007990 [Epithemia clementina (nom. ined.)]
MVTPNKSTSSSKDKPKMPRSSNSGRSRRQKNNSLCSFWKIAVVFLVMYGSLVWKTAWVDVANLMAMHDTTTSLGDGLTIPFLAKGKVSSDKNNSNKNNTNKKGNADKDAKTSTKKNKTQGAQYQSLPVAAVPPDAKVPRIRVKTYAGTTTAEKSTKTTKIKETDSPLLTAADDGQNGVLSLGVSEFSKLIQDTWLSSSLHSLLLRSSSPSHSAKSSIGGEVEGWYEKLLKEMEHDMNNGNNNNISISSTKRKGPLVSCRRRRRRSIIENESAEKSTSTKERKSSSSSSSSSSTVEFNYSADPISSCREAAGGSDGWITSGPFHYYNPHPNKERIVCGTSIPPKGTIVFDQLCPEPVTGRLFPTIPTPDGTGMPPVVARFEVSTRSSAKDPFPDCDIPCSTMGRFSLVSKRYIEGTKWEITMSMEGPLYYPQILVKPEGWKKNKFYSTTSFQSEIPLPYYSEAEYKIWNAVPVDFDNAIHGGVFMARNCGSRNNREQVIKTLQELANDNMKIHSVSTCLNNADIPPGSTKTNKNSIMNKYLFYFAFENQCYPDYITEKLWGPMEAGTLPVYFGAPNVREHVPKHSIILLDDFGTNVEDPATIKALFRYLEQVANNKTLYDSYHAWRHLPQPEFDAKLNLTYTHGTCRTCRWAYARLYGLGWNHPQQRVEDLYIARQTCIATETGLLQHPVEESWLLHQPTAAQIDTKLQAKRTLTMHSSASPTHCLQGTLAQDEMVLTAPVDQQEASETAGEQEKLVRIVRQVDGVIDMEVHALHRAATNNHSSFSLSPSWMDNIQWQFTTKLATNATFVRVKEGHSRLQDGLSRITIITTPKTVTLSARKNVLTLDGGIGGGGGSVFPLRLRIISENIDTFHQGADQAENHFASVMIGDFYHPVEVFRQEAG